MAVKHTVLFIDDEDNILQALRGLFQEEGYDILLAPTGSEGLELLQRHPVSLVISDQNMPGLNGTEVLARVKELAPNTFRMLMTGHSDMETAVRAINDLGISRYIIKPWDDGELKLVVRDALKRFDLEEQNRILVAELSRKNAELEDFNASLEHTVASRTRQLHYKIVELEGKDRIAQHMLSLHSLSETLDLVLQVISDIIKLDKAVVYLTDEGDTRAAAAIGLSAAGAIAEPAALDALEITPLHLGAFAAIRERGEPINIAEPLGHSIPPFAVVPVRRGDELLGFIEVSNPRSQHQVSPAELQVVASFALQAAIAISDAQARGDMNSWRGALADVLKEVGSLDQPDD